MRQLEKLIINTNDAKYFARGWRTETLKSHAANEVTKMVQAFIPEGFHVKVVEGEWEVSGFPHAPRHTFMATLRSQDPDGSDAHFVVHSYSEAGCMAKLLAVILDGRGFYPLT